MAVGAAQGLSLSMPLCWLSLSVPLVWGCREPVLPSATHPRSLIIYGLN